MEGTNETSNAKFQARTSYLPQGEGLLDVLISKLITSHSIPLHCITEILWGHRFESMLIYRRDQNRYQVNFSAFHSSFEVATPTLSAKQLYRIMGSFVPPGMNNMNNESSSSQSYSLPSTLNRRRQIRRQQQTVLEDLNNLQVCLCLPWRRSLSTH